MLLFTYFRSIFFMKRTYAIKLSKNEIRQFQKIVDWHMKYRIKNRKSIAKKMISIKTD